ncbi:amidase [soil metagenome]
MRGARGRLVPLLGGILVVWFSGSGCTVPRPWSGVTDPPHAFLTYHPPPEGSTALRLAVKDLIDMEGEVTTAGSQFLMETAGPAERDAACLRRARRDGVTIVGKTNLTEFAIGLAGCNDYFGTPVNPITADGKRIPGGSSSGSAVAVALGLADVALGTDTAGSIQVPAACCGVAGLKTTFGLIPLEGVYPIAPEHLDTVGPLAKDVAGLVTGMELLQDGFGARYAAARAAKPSARAIRVGRLYVRGTDRQVDEAVDRALALSGFEVVRLPEAFALLWKQAQEDGTAVAATGAWLTNREHRFRARVDPRSKGIILLGRAEHGARNERALARKGQWQRALAAVLEDVDAVALPTLKKLPIKIPLFGGPGIFEARVLALQNTVAVNLAGNPALALPIPVEDQAIPVTSLQLVGRPYGEAELLNIGRLVERNAAGWPDRAQVADGRGGRDHVMGATQ